ncbi:MAG: hypothetical protein GY700_06390 [Propionibacteriaceae bacterium]|nr:hypothetical protein [Propionibacteriaceae bacterium]
MATKLPPKRTAVVPDKNFRTIAKDLKTEATARVAVNTKVDAHKTVIADRATQTIHGRQFINAVAHERTVAVGFAGYHTRNLTILAWTEDSVNPAASRGVWVYSAAPGSAPVLINGSTLTFGNGAAIVTELAAEIDKDNYILVTSEQDSSKEYVVCVRLNPDEPRIKAEIERSGG